MLTRLRARVALLRPRGAASGRDAGFTLIEVIVSSMVMTVVMASSATFFIMSMSLIHQQRDKQIAVQLASDALERARSLNGADLVSGRSQAAVAAQVEVAGVDVYLSPLAPAWDQTLTSTSTITPVLPLAPELVQVNGVGFEQYWYIGKCWQSALTGDCTNVPGPVELYDVIVAVTWPDRQCAANLCSYVASTLVSDAAKEPIFNENATPPTVAPIADQIGEVSVAVRTVSAVAVSVAMPVTWTSSGLPAGVTINRNTGAFNGTPGNAGTYSVTVVATDRFGGQSTAAAFTWLINTPPTLTKPANQTTGVGGTVSLPIVRAGGTAPFTWTATGLPAGLVIDPAAGVIAGTATTAVAGASVQVTVADAQGTRTTTAAFTWTVSPVTVTTPAAQTGTVGTAVTAVQLAASGGASSYTWAAAGLPPGLSIDPTGNISGTPTTAGSYSVTVTVTDASAATGVTTPFTWTVAP